MSFAELLDDCPPGQESKGERLCEDCEVNHYKPFPGAFRCMPCPDATDTQNKTGARECGKSIK